MANTQPKRPVAVSGPGALSRRTDGGAGSKKQPIRTPTGGEYGEAQALTQQQQAAPMSAGGPPAATGAGPASPVPGLDVFGPTGRPGESPTAGIEQPGLYTDEDPYLLVRIAYQMYPHPSLARLLPEE